MNHSLVRTKQYCAVLLAFLLAFSLCTQALAANGFRYQHDPRENPVAMRDIVEDENAVYGFRPSETGSLKTYADADWSDPALVEQGRQDRIAYHQSIESMYEMLEEMEARGCTVEEIARAVSTRRNEIRLEAYADDPEGLAALKARNLERYGHEEGPLPDELYTQYGSWERVLEKAFSPNAGMDACLGLYDDYYFLYVALGDVPSDPAEQNGPSEPAAPDDPATPGEPSGDGLCRWDEKDHGTSLWGRLVSAFHTVLYFFARLFGRR
ncbi:MAG: hypothetical protein IJK89_12515 [Clostridia bacterium]|nr:hypothetical protein [Clostridia bacterium]